MTHTPATPAPAVSSAEQRRQVCDWLASQRGEMEAMLARIVNTDSGSRQSAGIEQVASLLRAPLEQAGWRTEWLAQPGYGACLQAELPGQDPQAAPVLLLGHMDTVFPAGTAAARPYRVEDGKAFGPGVADMKSGLVLHTWVAQALARSGGAPRPLRLFFSCDEEIGSPATRGAIRQAAQSGSRYLTLGLAPLAGQVPRPLRAARLPPGAPFYLVTSRCRCAKSR